MAYSFVFGVPTSFALLARGLERQCWPDETQRVLAEIDPDYGNFAIKFRGHGVLLCLRCPSQLASLAGLEHGRTVPLAGVRPSRRLYERVHATAKTWYRRAAQGLRP